MIKTSLFVALAFVSFSLFGQNEWGFGLVTISYPTNDGHFLDTFFISKVIKLSDMACPEFDPSYIEKDTAEDANFLKAKVYEKCVGDWFYTEITAAKMHDLDSVNNVVKLGVILMSGSTYGKPRLRRKMPLIFMTKERAEKMRSKQIEWIHFNKVVSVEIE